MEKKTKTTVSKPGFYRDHRETRPPYCVRRPPTPAIGLKSKSQPAADLHSAPRVRFLSHFPFYKFLLHPSPFPVFASPHSSPLLSFLIFYCLVSSTNPISEFLLNGVFFPIRDFLCDFPRRLLWLPKGALVL